MPEKLYKKVHYLDLECIAVWDDFYGPGAEEERVVWKETRGPFTEERAKKEWEDFCKYVNSTDREKLRRAHNVADSKISARRLYSSEKDDFHPSDFYFQRHIREEFEEAK